jgi:large subunit ribosomal protein L21
MYAIFNHKGKQYKASKNDFLKLPKSSDLKKNDTLTLEDITLLKTENGDTIIGSPTIKDVKIKAKVIEQIRDKKIIVFKKKRRHNYRRKIGHRQDLTLVKIEEIVTSSSSNKKSIENKPKKEVSDGS